MRYALAFLITFLTFCSNAQEIIDSLLFQAEESVYFDSDSYKLEAEQASKIDSFIRQDSGSNLIYSIQAHTDNIGSDNYNLTLSENRAQTVIEYLIEAGLTEEMISSAFHGEAIPIASNDSDTGRSQNRRVSIKKYRKIKLQWLDGIVKDSITNEGISAKVKLHTKSYEYSTETDSNGVFKLLGPLGAVVGIDIRAKGYFLQSEMMKLSDPRKIKPLSIGLPPIQIGRSMRLDKLFFEGDKDILLSKSSRTLKELELFMIENDQICIEIEGHINRPNYPPVKEDSWNYYLSVARAKKIHTKLVELGIDENRMSFKGYGNWRMVFPKAKSEYHMAKNRRVEIKVVSCATANAAVNDTVPANLDFSIPRQRRF